MAKVAPVEQLPRKSVQLQPKDAASPDGKSKLRILYESLKQQRLEATHPLLTIRVVVPFYLAIAALFILIGIALFLAAQSVSEQVIPYGNCKNAAGLRCADFLRYDYRHNETGKPLASRRSCNCTVAFQLEEEFKGDVYFYYALSNFYQNHRRFFSSYSPAQMLSASSLRDLGGCAAPFDGIPIPGTDDEAVDPFLPCGAQANSLFNDSFTLWYQAAASKKPDIAVELSWEDTFHSSNLDRYGDVPKSELAKYQAPPNWGKGIGDLNGNYSENNGFRNSDFINWMRPAAFSGFRKLWRKLVRKSGSDFEKGLPKANYELEIAYNYPVDYYVKNEDESNIALNEYAKKYFIISTASWAGGRSPFLGLVYIATGLVSLGFALGSLLLHRQYGKWETVGSKKFSFHGRSPSVSTVQILNMK